MFESFQILRGSSIRLPATGRGRGGGIRSASTRPSFDHAHGAARTRAKQCLLDPVEHLGSAVLGQLHLDLRPRCDAGRRERCGQ